ncbi:DUF2274 domain-containing protein [Hyphomonas sp.]|uniref:DUF2274 domain-containing protein n=1 Tax=Hyphomonas sp. TaxID=87 RepID=UPI003F6F0EAB
MTKHQLKIGPLPDRTPTKLSIAISPDLQADLADYAAVYRETYGDDAPVAALVPHMLSAFLAGDAGFRRARKALGS